jgi:hypothetical protein
MPVSLSQNCVIRADKLSPIQTYRGRGVAKKNLTKNDHAIIHTGIEPPKPAEGEHPMKHNEAAMRPPIQVVGRERGAKMDTMSRVNYRKIYTVEHNVKVFDFGNVHQDDIENLVSNFNNVWQFEPRQSYQTPTTHYNTHGEEEGDGKEEGGDEEEQEGQYENEDYGKNEVQHYNEQAEHVEEEDDGGNEHIHN